MKAESIAKGRRFRSEAVMLKKYFGQQLVLLRESHGLSTEDLVEITGISDFATYRAIEIGGHPMSSLWTIAVRLAQVFDISLDFFSPYQPSSKPLGDATTRSIKIRSIEKRIDELKTELDHLK